MTGDGACGGDMPTFPSPAHGEIPPVGDPAYDAMLARALPPGDAPAGLSLVAGAFAALRAAPADSGMSAEANALAAFRDAVGRPSEPARPRRRRHPMLACLLSAKLAALAAAAAFTLGGAAAAAYTGKLPAPVQKLAHDAIGAPRTPGAQPAHSATPQPTVLPGHSAYGLCTAYAHLKLHGNAARKATAFRQWCRPRQRVLRWGGPPWEPLPRNEIRSHHGQAFHASFARKAHPPSRQAHPVFARAGHPSGGQAHQRLLTTGHPGERRQPSTTAPPARLPGQRSQRHVAEPHAPPGGTSRDNEKGRL
jgi:hypothetical protein